MLPGSMLLELSRPPNYKEDRKFTKLLDPNFPSTLTRDAGLRVRLFPSLERRMKFANRHHLNRKSGGRSRPVPPCPGSPWCVPWRICSFPRGTSLEMFFRRRAAPHLRQGRGRSPSFRQCFASTFTISDFDLFREDSGNWLSPAQYRNNFGVMLPLHHAGSPRPAPGVISYPPSNSGCIREV